MAFQIHFLTHTGNIMLKMDDLQLSEQEDVVFVLLNVTEYELCVHAMPLKVLLSYARAAATC